MFSHFDYELGTPEQVDDTHVDVPATLTNANMSKAVKTWYSDFMNCVMEDPTIASDNAALEAKSTELLKAAVDKTAEAEDGTVTTDVTISMVLEDGQWKIKDPDGVVIEAITGGFMSAISELAQ